MAFVIRLGGELSWALLLFIPVVVTSARKNRQRSAHAHPHRAGQAGRNPEHSARNRHRQPHREGLQHRAVGDFALQERRQRLFRANLRSVRIQSISSPLMDYHRRDCHRDVPVDRPQRDPARPHDDGHLRRLHHPALQALRSGAQVRLFLQQLPAGDGRFGVDLRFLRREGRRQERPHAATLKGFRQSVQFENVGFSYSTEEGEHQILHNVDLEVRAGEVLAWLAPAGRENPRWST